MHPDQPVYNKPVRPRASATAALDPWLPALDNTWRFVAADGRAFVSVPASSPGGLLHLPVRSDAFRDWYFAQTNGTLNRIPTGRTFSMICQYLEADAARIPDNRWNVYRRVGPAGDGAVQIDLSNPAGEYVEITPEGYHVQSGNRGPSFENSATNVSMPAPKSEGSADALERLRGALNLSGADWLRCLTWLVSALSPNGPYPMLVLRGPSGCGKSVAGRVLRGLVDPSSAPFAGMPRSAAQFLHLARQNWVLAFDHVSRITPNLADALCRITSGAGLSAREPGRHDLVQYWIKRPVLLTVTEDCELPADLAGTSAGRHPPRTHTSQSPAGIRPPRAAQPSAIRNLRRPLRRDLASLDELPAGPERHPARRRARLDHRGISGTCRRPRGGHRRTTAAARLPLPTPSTGHRQPALGRHRRPTSPPGPRRQNSQRPRPSLQPPCPRDRRCRYPPRPRSPPRPQSPPHRCDTPRSPALTTRFASVGYDARHSDS